MTFWDVQVNACKCMERLGIKIPLLQRVAIFQLWAKLNRLELDASIPREFINDARDALSGILYFRNQGKEPAHANGMYIKK